MNRVFIQAYARYPHGGALANYIQNLAEAIVCAGYEVILAVDINKEYDVESVISLSKPITVIPIMKSENAEKWQEQQRTGYSAKRLGVLKKFDIDNKDCVIVLDLRNEYFLKRLFEFGKEIGFRTICGVFELFGQEDYDSIEEFRKFTHIYEEVYLESNAILSVSGFIDNYYMNKGIKVYRLPPMVDSNKYTLGIKKMDKYRFIIPAQKDSLKAMLTAFAGLDKQELNRLELHLCGEKSGKIREAISESEWRQLEPHAVIYDWLRYEELVDLYQQIHFLVIARNVSRRTLANFPSKVPECMSLGIVPIVSDVGDYTKYYLRNDVDSIFIQGDSVKEIRKSIRKALAFSDKQFEAYSQNAISCAKIKFDYHNWLDKVQEIVQGK